MEDSNPIPNPSPISRIFPIVLISLLIFSFSLSAFLGYQNLQLRKLITKFNDESIITPTPTTISDPIANWKTYINNDYNFMFKYPANLSPTNDSRGEALAISFEEKDIQNIYFSVSRHEDSSPSLESIIETEKSYLIGHVLTEIVSESSFKLFGEKARKFTFSLENGEERTSVFFKKGNYLYAISADNKLTDQILSTFKFTGQNTRD